MIHYDDRNGYKNILLPIKRMLSVIVNFVKYKTSTMLQPAFVNTMFQRQRNTYFFSFILIPGRDNIFFFKFNT